MDYIKNETIEKLLNNYKLLNWERDNFDLNTTVGSFNVHLSSGRDGLALVITREPVTAETIIVTREEDERVSDLYENVFNFINESKKKEMWSEFYDALDKLCLGIGH